MQANSEGQPGDERSTPADTNGRISSDTLPDPTRTLPELKIYSHSTLIYWWPVWMAGYIMAAITYFAGGTIELDQVRNEYLHPSSAPGVTFVMILMLAIIFTNVKIRGIYSLAFVLAISFVFVLLAWFGWWDEIFTLLPHLSVHMNMGFYLFFSTALLVVWLLMFLLFDRLTFWRIRPGLLTEEHVIGGGEQSYDVQGMLFEQHSDDFFRHVVFGLGAGDLRLITSGAKQATIEIPNVLFADRKVKIIQKLVSVKPDDLLGQPIGDVSGTLGD